MRIDKFFYNNPEKRFINYLKKPIHSEMPKNFGRREARRDEVFIGGCYIAGRFPCDADILDTAYEDFNLFLSVMNISGDAYPIVFKNEKLEGNESFKIEVSLEKCDITAENTEGVRRALIFLEGEITRREGAFLPIGVISRKPYINDRITRGFFSPTNRHP